MSPQGAGTNRNFTILRSWFVLFVPEDLSFCAASDKSSIGMERVPYECSMSKNKSLQKPAAGNEPSSFGRTDSETGKRGETMQALPYVSFFLRLALGFSFLSAVADRLGWWGTFGQPNVAWGSFGRFVSYTGTLNWFLPQAMIPALAIIATCAEALMGVGLIVGWQTRAAAVLSGFLLLLFGVTMTAALGVKAPLDFSVFSAAGGAFLLATCAQFPFSVDSLFH